MVMQFKKILNLSEEATHLRLREACESRGASVYPKVRVADVLPIEDSGIEPKQYEFALKAHFDFVVTDSEHNPLGIPGRNSGDSIQQLTDDMRQRQNLQPWQGSPEWSFRISCIMWCSGEYAGWMYFSLMGTA